VKHHHDLVAHSGNDPEIMRDEDDGSCRVGGDLIEQLQDLRLNRHVERRRRLICYQQIRPA
jgi:hypothetical protein